MRQDAIYKHSVAKNGIPGFIAYLLVAMWFLLTVMASAKAEAQEIETAPVVLTASDILPEIEGALSKEGMPPGAEISLSSPEQIISANGAATISFVSYNPASGRFVIRINDLKTPIAGYARAVLTFPVVSRVINRGEIITEADIAYLQLANSRPGLFIDNAEALIGMAARRPLKPQTPLRRSDVAAPILVKKGTLITLTYALDGLRLSHQGIALASGGAGEVISVRNVQSDRVLKAIVQSENLARVAAPRALPVHSES